MSCSPLDSRDEFFHVEQILSQPFSAKFFAALTRREVPAKVMSRRGLSLESKTPENSGAQLLLRHLDTPRNSEQTIAIPGDE